VPSEPELARQFGVSRTTVRLAVGDLAASGYVTRRQGRGTFVAARSGGHASSRLYGFAEDLRRHYPDVQLDIVRLRVEPASQAVASQLERPAGTQVITIHRMARVDGRPVFYETSWLVAPFHVQEAQLAAEKSSFDHVYGFFERNGIRVGLGTQTIRAALAGEEDVSRLGVAPGDPILVIVRTTRDDSGAPIEFSEVRYVGAMYQYEVNLTRSEA
jgi:GntR family transcriptional regulator